MARPSRALSVDQILKKKFIELKFTGEWLDFLGEPEANGAWIIWGVSGNGKSSFAMQLARELTKFGKVAYNALEEGARKSMQKNIRDRRMHEPEVKRNFILLDCEPIEELKERLRKKHHPKFVIIDSLQYTGLTYIQYKKMKEEFRNVLFIFISHADGREPDGQVAKRIRYDADVKIRVEGYKAFSTSRLGGGEPYTIWAEAAAKYWLNLTKD
jgi:adenosyl cobinamide kinase/adenosyl cobinamide phosphate guanylyltransferase